MKSRVLIVDDVKAECRMLCDALGAFEFDAHWALSGADALNALCNEPFDVVVTDLNMPNLN